MIWGELHTRPTGSPTRVSASVATMKGPVGIITSIGLARSDLDCWNSAVTAVTRDDSWSFSPTTRHRDATAERNRSSQ